MAQQTQFRTGPPSLNLYWPTKSSFVLASNPSLIWPKKPILLGPLSLSRDPLFRNGQLLCSPFGQQPSPWDWSSPDPPLIKALSDGMVIVFFLYIQTLSDGMVIDFLMFTSRPSPMEWSLIFLCLHQGPLRLNGHWFSYVYIKALSDGMVIDFLMFTSRPSPIEWSFIFLCLHQGPLWWNGHWFSYVYIKALSDGMVIDFLMFTSRLSPMEWSLIFLCLHQGPLRWNGHWFSYVYIKTLSYGMVESCFYLPYHDPFHVIDHQTRVNRFLLIFFFLKIQTKLLSLSLLIFYCNNLKMSHFHII